MITKRFTTYDEAIQYLSGVFNKAGFWEATISWSERTEFEERPYKLVLLAPSTSMLKGVETQEEEK